MFNKYPFKKYWYSYVLLSPVLLACIMVLLFTPMKDSRRFMDWLIDKAPISRQDKNHYHDELRQLYWKVKEAADDRRRREGDRK